MTGSGTRSPRSSASSTRSDTEFHVEPDEDHRTLASVLKRRVSGLTWSQARALVETGRVEVDESPIFDPSRRVSPGERIRVHEHPHPKREVGPLIVFEDRHVVVAEKPAGMSSVPYERGERETLMDAIRAEWRRCSVPPSLRALHVVHRLDQETSGLLVFARTRASERNLQMQFRKREVSRVYLCLAHGSVRSGKIESRLVANRGDGLRGSTSSREEGKLAVTYIRVRKRFSRTTLCEARLETGRTHQIRIHLSERGHPLVGEKVYIRDFAAPIAAPRLMLHASTLAFDHPVRGGRLSLESARTAEFLALVEAIGGKVL